MTYQRSIDRHHPGCIIFLLDQSGSMAEPMGGQPTSSKADALAVIINKLLHTIVRRCVKDQDGPPRYYYDLAVIGYAEEAKSAFSGELADRPLVSVQEVAAASVLVEDRGGVVRPEWFGSVAGSRTAMCAALDLAGRVASGWIGLHQDSFPPIVLNISDGKATDGDPTEWARQLRGLHTLDGELLLFNINLATGAPKPIAFPVDPSGLPDDYSRQMFALSSLLPDFMRKHANARNLPAEVGARGFVCNAHMDTVVSALAVGTTLDQLAEY
jgi:hypothetical protein